MVILSKGDDVVTWVVGHVLHQAEPGDYDDKYIRWRPQDFSYRA